MTYLSKRQKIRCRKACLLRETIKLCQSILRYEYANFTSIFFTFINFLKSFAHLRKIPLALLCNPPEIRNTYWVLKFKAFISLILEAIRLRSLELQMNMHLQQEQSLVMLSVIQDLDTKYNLGKIT